MVSLTLGKIEIENQIKIEFEILEKRMLGSCYKLIKNFPIFSQIPFFPNFCRFPLADRFL